MSSSENAPSVAICYFQEYATTITITAGNLILPFIFSYVIEFEEYDQKVGIEKANLLDLLNTKYF